LVSNNIDECTIGLEGWLGYNNNIYNYNCTKLSERSSHRVPITLQSRTIINE